MMAQQNAKKPKAKSSTSRAGTGTASRAKARPAKPQTRKVNSLVAKPVKAFQHEHPQTLAKMAMAAVTPALIKVGLRFLARHPLVAIGGALLVAAAAYAAGDEEV